MDMERPGPSGRPVAFFAASKFVADHGGLTKSVLRRIRHFDRAGWDTHLITVLRQAEKHEVIASLRAAGQIPAGTVVHDYQRRDRAFRPSWDRPTDEAFSRDDRIADWLDWLVAGVPGAVLFADSPVMYAPTAKMRNPFVGRVMTVHLAHRPRASRAPAPQAPVARYKGTPGLPKLATRFLPYATAADAVVVPTHRQAEHLRQDVPGLDVTVIPNMIERHDPAQSPPRDLDRVVVVSRLDPPKRVGHAIRAFALARGSMRQLRLEIHGDGPDRPALEELVAQLDLSDVVTFHGWTREPLRVLASAGASIMTSRSEGFGLAVAESMSVGTPVVAFDVDYGPAELVTDGVTGALVPNGSIEALAAGLVRTLEDPARWALLSEACLHQVEPLMPEVVATRWLDLAEEVGRRKAVRQPTLLVEDLRVGSAGLRLSGVCLGAEDRSDESRQLVFPNGTAVPLYDSPPGADSRRTGPREVEALLPDDVLAGWGTEQPLRAAGASGSDLRVLGPGLALTVVPSPRGVHLVGPAADGSVRRSPATTTIALHVSDRKVLAWVGQDMTDLSRASIVTARILDSEGGRARLWLSCPAPVRISGDSTFSVSLVRADDHRRRTVGVVVLPALSETSEGVIAAVRWETGLARITADWPDAILWLGSGDGSQLLSPIAYAAASPTVRDRGGIRVEPTSSGGSQLVGAKGSAWRIWARR